jgi:hypothetical protein
MSAYVAPRRPDPRHDGPRICKTPGCKQQRNPGRQFCGSCWYLLTPAFRLAIEQAFSTGIFGGPATRVRSAGAFIVRQRRAEREAPREIALCGRCDRPACDATTCSCSDRSCPFAVRIAA